MGKKSSSVILALDISSRSTGYAVLREGTWSGKEGDFGIVTVPAHPVLSRRLVNFRNEIATLVRRVKPTHIIIEDVFSGRNVATMKLLARFNGVALEVCRRLSRRDPQVALAAVVRAGIGCGRGKEDAFKYVCGLFKLDWSFNKMNDVTDALALALYSYKTLNKE